MHVKKQILVMLSNRGTETTVEEIMIAVNDPDAKALRGDKRRYSKTELQSMLESMVLDGLVYKPAPGFYEINHFQKKLIEDTIKELD